MLVTSCDVIGNVYIFLGKDDRIVTDYTYIFDDASVNSAIILV